jgi:hypothetical protein
VRKKIKVILIKKISMRGKEIIRMMKKNGRIIEISC